MDVRGFGREGSTPDGTGATRGGMAQSGGVNYGVGDTAECTFGGVVLEIKYIHA